MRTLLQSKYIVPSLGGLLVLIVITALLSPLDKTLGSSVRMVYVHGAIIRVILALFVGAGALGAAFIALKRRGLIEWARALYEAALILWVLYLGISVITTLQTWGGIPWFEPRWAFTLQMTVLAPILYMAGVVLKNDRVMAGLYAAYPVIMLFLLSQARLVLHPIDPIAASGNAAMQLAYLIMLVWWALVGVQVVRGLRAWRLTRHLRNV
jgi:hypothetical protein